MQVVISTVNYVKARELNSRTFKQLCITENSNHHTLLMHTAVRWLSRGKTLERVFLLRRELAIFLQDKGHKNAHGRLLGIHGFQMFVSMVYFQKHLSILFGWW